MELKYDQLVRQHELKQEDATNLKNVLKTCKVVLLCDDSSSMGSKISEPGMTKTTTRWAEEKKLAAIIIEFVTAIDPLGLDIYFLNRNGKMNVQDMTGLQDLFSSDPYGRTPLRRALQKIFKTYSNLPNNQQLLVIVITDGEPSDCTEEELFRVINNKKSNVHVSFVECTDNEENMEYLDKWDNKIPNFDNTDDYREELRRIKQINGQDFKFDYVDYVIKILLATFIKKYFNLDQGVTLSSLPKNNRIINNNNNKNTQQLQQRPQPNSNDWVSPQTTYNNDAVCCVVC